jgi:phospholipase/carboxylesterase
MYTHSSNYINQGTQLSEAKSAIIMIHGRGSTAENIASLARELKLKDAAVLAPQATNNSWYPYSFLAPVEENQPALDSALERLDELVSQVKTAGLPLDRIYFLGFSQGACLALEYTARNAAAYGGVIAFTGGLIGQQLSYANYKGDFGGMPVPRSACPCIQG